VGHVSTEPRAANSSRQRQMTARLSAGSGILSFAPAAHFIAKA
jgi:hypothetical protein